MIYMLHTFMRPNFIKYFNVELLSVLRQDLETTLDQDNLRNTTLTSVDSYEFEMAQEQTRQDIDKICKKMWGAEETNLR